MDAKEVTALLREKGFKVTPQRLAIYNVLSNTTEHPSAEMIFSKLQEFYPTMSLATVYKTIEILKEIELVQILNVGEESFRYDANTDTHPHVRCLVCNRVDDIYGVDESAYVNQISEKTAYRLSGQQFYFYGVCPECQSKAGKMH
ncbi:Fur family transcriptional regulator, peroxide stress response regulator [Propionispira arboris]|uniref:Fur family transcriptional regulator, peroxide stress response regulator n=1 Tax=Propionispira arboris TaxID=84035 RepID=A0A1H6U4M4_9FIRM|nr:Fur family transcriptional regulator [Propionispira arboris]SEI87243.1 Fur family transcriptional regulator, peroxide stress response regulator [Propionispira arboris]